MSDTMDGAAVETPTTESDASEWDAAVNELGLHDDIAEHDAAGADFAAQDAEEADQPEEDTDEAEPDDLVELKVNGKKMQKPMSEVVALAQKQVAGEAKLEQAKAEIEEARQAKQQAESQKQAVIQLMEVLKRGDLDVIAEFARERLGAGDAFDQAVIKYALKLYEYSNMSPEQQRAVQNERLLEKYKMEAQERQRMDQERAMEYRVNQWSEHIATELPKAITQAGLPDTDFVREHVISTWRAALEQGQNPTAAAVAQFVKQRLADADLIRDKHPAMPERRPKATRESVGLKREKGTADGEYISWENRPWRVR